MAINLITDIDYQNNFSFSGFIGDDITHAQDNNSINGNYSKITNNNWHINVKASQTKVNLEVQDMAVRRRWSRK